MNYLWVQLSKHAKIRSWTRAAGMSPSAASCSAALRFTSWSAVLAAARSFSLRSFSFFLAWNITCFILIWIKSIFCYLKQRESESCLGCVWVIEGELDGLAVPKILQQHLLAIEALLHLHLKMHLGLQFSSFRVHLDSEVKSVSPWLVHCPDLQATGSQQLGIIVCHDIFENIVFRHILY